MAAVYLAVVNGDGGASRVVGVDLAGDGALLALIGAALGHDDRELVIERWRPGDVEGVEVFAATPRALLLARDAACMIGGAIPADTFDCGDAVFVLATGLPGHWLRASFGVDVDRRELASALLCGLGEPRYSWGADGSLRLGVGASQIDAGCDLAVALTLGLRVAQLPDGAIGVGLFVDGDFCALASTVAGA